MTIVTTSDGTTPADASTTERPPSTWRRHRWILTRILFGVVTIFVVSIVIFIITTMLPGDAAYAILGRTASPERVAALQAALGLDKPPVVRYLGWLGGLLRGDFGTSLAARTPVIDLIGPRIVNTLSLLSVTIVIAIPLAIVIGIAAAYRPRGIGDGIVNAMSVVVAALPEFVIGIVLISLFAAGGLAILPAVSLVPTGSTAFARPEILVLPAATLILVSLPYLLRQVRASLLDIVGSEYIVMADMKGLTRRRILFRHALRNGLQPLIQASALSMAYLLGGTVIIEFLFQFPGLGYTLTDAARARDVPVVQAVVLILAIGYVLFNLLADILTVYSTPKLRTR